jgi:hypothetical protein
MMTNASDIRLMRHRGPAVAVGGSVPRLPRAIPFTCDVREPDRTVWVPSCDDRCRLGLDLECSRCAVEVTKDCQVYGVPLACHLFPIRDDPSAIATGRAEPVVSPGCGDVRREFAAQRNPVICCANLKSPTRSPDRNRSRMLPPQGVFCKAQGGRDLPNGVDQPVRDRPPCSRRRWRPGRVGVRGQPVLPRRAPFGPSP